MPLSVPRKTRRPPTWAHYYGTVVFLTCILLIGPALICHSIYADYRDRPSLQWPKVSGVIMQCQEAHHGLKHTYYYVEDTYSYAVNGQRHTSRRIALWNPNLDGEDARARAFVIAHPVNSTVNVYYDPQHPENAVLIPGPDEAGNRRFIWTGGLCFIGMAWIVFSQRKALADMKARIRAADARASAGVPHLPGLPHGFASYEPGGKRKLSIFPDKECLDDVLGKNDGKPLLEWKPEDRMIDAAGHEYRLVKAPGNKSYDLEPTGGNWTCERLLDVAQADGRLPKCDPASLRQQLAGVPAGMRIAALLKAMDEPSARARWAMAGFILFLILFFLIILFGAGSILMWLSR